MIVIETILACFFPLIFAGVIRILIPVRLLESQPSAQSRSEPDTSQLTLAHHLSFSLPFAIGFVLLAYPIGIAQDSLFRLVNDDGAVFLNRATDNPVYPFIPSLFVSIFLSFALTYQLHKWRLGSRLYEILDRPNRSRTPSTIRQELRFFSTDLWLIAGLATILNSVAFDTFLRVSNNDISMSGFFSPFTERYPVETLSGIEIIEKRRAPNGNINEKPWLRFRFDDGNTLDTFYLVELEQLPSVVSSIEHNPDFSGRVVHLDGFGE